MRPGKAPRRAARKILGMAIGMHPKEKIFKTYIDMEMQLGNIDRCRTLYEKALELNPFNCSSWVKFAELEKSLAETERTRAIFEIAVGMDQLDQPEILWKAYIDFETEEGDRGRCRALYERLLERTQHVKVWISFAQFELRAMALNNDDDDDETQEPEAAAARRAAAEEAAAAADPEEAGRDTRPRTPLGCASDAQIAEGESAGCEGGAGDAARGVARVRGGRRRRG